MLTLIQIKTNGDIVEKKVKKIEENTLYKPVSYTHLRAHETG